MVRKKYSFLAFVALLFIALSGCLKEKEFPFEEPFRASFRYELLNKTNKVPILVKFSSSSRSATSFSWDFGNGQTSTAESVEVLYEEEGIYVVSLTATGKDGSTQTARDSIIISNAFTAVNLRSIDVLAFPQRQPNSNLPYDSTRTPNFNFRITEGANLLYINNPDSTRSSVIRTELPVRISGDRVAPELSFFNNPFTFNPMNRAISIKLMDIQAPPLNELEVASFNINLHDYTALPRPYSSPITLEAGETRIRLNLVWR